MQRLLIGYVLEKMLHLRRLMGGKLKKQFIRVPKGVEAI
jgi:hypothetical protein